MGGTAYYFSGYPVSWGHISCKQTNAGDRWEVVWSQRLGHASGLNDDRGDHLFSPLAELVSRTRHTWAPLDGLYHDVIHFLSLTFFKRYVTVKCVIKMSTPNTDLKTQPENTHKDVELQINNSIETWRG